MRTYNGVIFQLQNDALVIGKDDVQKVLDDVTKAIQDRIRTEGEQEAEKHKLQLIKTTNNSINAIEGQENISMSELNVALVSALGELEKQTKAYVELIKTESAKRLQNISTEEQTAVKRVKLEIDSGERKIASQTENAIKQIIVDRDEGVKRMETEADAGVKKISSEADDVLMRIGEKLKAKNEQSEDIKYNKLKKDLQSDLTTYYKEICGTIPICPCLDQVDAPLIKAYIPPYPLYSQQTDKLKQLSKQGKGQETETSEGIPVDSLQKIFNKESKECKHIYLTAEPGVGKTSFVKWLALNWCQAHSPVINECCYFDQNDVNQMKTFEFLFIFFLRETDVNESHVDSFIKNNVISALARQNAYTSEVLEKVMYNEKCLIILDGLDEWAKSGIPKRSTRKTCTYLTTSRPWKFCVLPLDSSKIDQDVHIKKVEQMCSEKLISRILSVFEERECLREDVLDVDNACQKFKSMLDEKNISQFYNTPVILVQLLYLWNITKKIGNSQCEIYGDVIDALFGIAEKKVQLLGKFKHRRPSKVTYYRTSFCETYYDLMIKLGKLAFETLFSENQESSLVFDEAVALKYLPADENATAYDVLAACLQTGLLSKQPVYVRSRRKQYTYSFYHKTVQEYFAALYIQTEYAHNVNVVDAVRRGCRSVLSILEMETVFMFLGGFNPSLARVTLQALQNTINEDDKTDMYRCRYLHPSDKEHDQMKAIQDMIVSCVTEMAQNGHGDQYLPLMDIIIDYSCMNASYFAFLKNLHKSNSGTIKSLVVSFLLSCSQDTMNNLNLFIKQVESEVLSLCKLQIDDSFISNEVHGSVARSAKYLKCLAVSIDVPGITYQLLGLKIPKLESLSLFLHKRVTRSSLEQLIYFVSHQTILKEVNLKIRCSVRRYMSCSAPLLDLSQHESLMKLSLKNVPLIQLQLNEHLRELTLDNLPLTNLQLNGNLRELTLDNLPLTNLQLNGSLRELTLDNLPLTYLKLNDHLQRVTLENVQLSYLQLNDQLQELTLRNVPLTHIELNDHLHELTLEEIPLTHLQLNDLLLKLMLKNVSLSELKLNDHLKDLEMCYGSLSHLHLNEHMRSWVLCNPSAFLRNLFEFHSYQNLNFLSRELRNVLQLQLNDQLQNLTLTNVSLSQLKLNDQLKQLVMMHVSVSKLELNEHLQKLFIGKVPISKLQLNANLVDLEIHDVQLTQLKANGQLRKLTLVKIPLTHLQLDDNLQRLTMEDVPLPHLQLNYHLQRLTLQNVPLRHLQLNDDLQKLALQNVPLPNLQLNYNLQALTLKNIPLTHLQLSDHVKELKLENIPLTQLQLTDHLQELKLENIPLTHLQLTDHLQELTLKALPLTYLQPNDQLKTLIPKNIPLMYLQLDDHISHIRNIHLISISLSSSTLSIFLDTVMNCGQDVSLKLEDITLKDIINTEHQETVGIDISQVKGQGFTSTTKSLELYSFNMTSKVLQTIVGTILTSEHSVTVALSNVTVEDVTSTEQQDTVNQGDTSVPALRGNSVTHGKKFQLTDVTMPSKTFKQFVDRVQECRYPVTVQLRKWRGREGIEYVRSLSPFTIVEDDKDRFSFRKVSIHNHGNLVT